ncbi:MAG: YcxB family protein, partial [Bacteroidota bacterium]|nr:YcxB family protein [Bacteroidota bacterium]
FIWAQYRKRYIIWVSYVLFVGLILIMSHQLGSDKERIINPDDPFFIHLDLMEFIGVVLLVLSCVYIFSFIRLRKTQLKRIKILSDRLSRENSNEIYITINDLTISYQSAFSKNEYVWEVVENYFLTEHFVFIFLNHSLESSIIIDKRLLTPEDFTALSAFIRQRLPARNRLL